MKRALAILAAAMMMAALIAPTAALAKQPEDKGKPEKSSVCHYEKETDSYTVLSLSGKALEAHQKHGDELAKIPFDAVPGMPGFHYDECTGDPQQHIYAVAYTDVNDDGAGYDADNDILIAKLVEGPGDAHDGSAGAGDLIITNQYPLDPTDPDLHGTFGITEHTVTAVSPVGTFLVFATGGGKTFTWRASTDFLQNQFYSEIGPSGASSFEDNFLSGYNDLVHTSTLSPSNPDSDVAISLGATGDNAFLDVDVYLP